METPDPDHVTRPHRSRRPIGWHRTRTRRRFGALLAGSVVVIAVIPQAPDMGGIPARAAAAPTTTATTGTTTAPSTPIAPRADRTRLALVRTITGDISPKSVASSGTGIVTAQNMMYRHTVTMYDSRRMRLIATIPDAVTLSRFGVSGHPGVSRGAPVEAAFSPDGTYEYVTNYAMYGAGFGPEGTDTCTPGSGYDRSFTYRIDVATRTIDRVYQVGAVPKVVRATPDGRFVLVSNWCSWDMSVISTRLGREIRRVPIGAYPRGIAVSPTGDVAYVAVMGGNDLMRVDLATWKTRSIGIGSGPRAVVFGPSGRFIYATLNAEGTVAKLDLTTGSVVSRVATGRAPRSLAISPDGTALYVVNYKSGSVSKVRSRDMKVLQTRDACYHPIGITYDAPTRRVWVACYGGEILVFDDR